MSALVASVTTAILAATLAAVGTYLTTRRNLQMQFDANLRDLRIKAYTELWKLLKVLAKYGRTQELARERAETLGGDLSKWYFETGGMYLSQPTRDDYFALQDAIERVLARHSSGALSTDEDDFLRLLSSRLRTGMTRDVGTRKTFIFRGDVPFVELRRSTKYRERNGDRRLVVARRARTMPWRRGRKTSAVVTVSPSDVGPKRGTWDPERGNLVLSPGTNEARLLLIENDELLEGPSGWTRGVVAPFGEVVAWIREGKSETHY